METVKYVLVLIYLLYFYIFIACASVSSHLGLCGNSQCSVPIGHGHMLTHYSSIDDSKLSIKPGEEVLIYVKEYGEKKDMIGVLHSSRRGYIGKNLIKETRSIVKRSALVPAEVEFRSQTGDLKSKIQDYSPTSSKEQHQESKPIVNTKHLEMSDKSSPHTEGFTSPPVIDQSRQLSYIPTSKLQKQMNSESHLELQKPSSILHSSSSSVLDDSIDHSQFESYDVDHYSNHIDSNIGNFLKPSSQSDQLESKTQTDSYFNNIEGVIDISSKSNFQSHPVDSMDSQNDVISKSSSFKSNESPNSMNDPDEDINADVSETKDDMSETMALLKERGIEETYLAKLIEESISSSATAKTQMHKVNTDQVNYNKRFKYVKPNSEKNNYVDTNDISSSKTDSSVLQEESKVFGTKEKVTQNSFDTLEDSENEIFDEDYDEDEVDEDDDENEILSTGSSHIIPNTRKTDAHVSHINNVAYSTFSSNPSEEVPLHTTTSLQDLKSSRMVPDANFEIRVETTNHVTEVPFFNNRLDSEVVDLQSTNVDLENKSPKTFHIKNTLENSFLQSSEFIENTIISNVMPPVNTEAQTSINSLNDMKQDISDDSKKDVETNLDETFESKQSEITTTFKNTPEESQTSTVNLYENMEYEQLQSSVSENHVLTDSLNHSSNANMEIDAAQIIDSKNATLSDNVVEDNSDINNMIDDAHKFDSEDDLDLSSVSISYQTRDLKGESLSTESSNSEYENKVEPSLFDFSFSEYIQSCLEVLRIFTETVMIVIPEPLYSYIMDFEKKGIPPRAIVFTALSAIPCLFLIVGTVYIKESSKEKKLSDHLLVAEKHLHSLSVEKQVLEEKIQVLTTELSDIQENFKKEKQSIEVLNSKLNFSKEQVQDSDNELKTSLETIDFLQKKEEEYLSTLSALQKEKNSIFEQNENLEKRLKEEEDSVTSLATQVQELEEDLKKLEEEKEAFIQAEVNYDGKISQLQLNCNQLLQEAEEWNIRVTVLSDELNKEKSLKDDFEKMVATKDSEIESLKNILQTMESFENSNESEEGSINTIEEKLKSFMDVSSTKIQLQREQEEKEALLEKLMLEKNKVLDFEVEIFEAKSEISKLKNSYNQALQDKTEAQTKLDVLSNYFKDKEIQLQKQLGAQEAVRQRTEDDASSAERRICLIEEENISYKYQVASMKQEMEETERNLKNQIAAQEKKAHENWLSARAAERKLEEVKQEAAQLRQRLTLFERESEAYANSAHDDVVRPVPKRLPGPSDKAALDSSNTMDMRYRGFEQHLPPHPLMLPPDRPTPPTLPPPPMPFMPLPHLDPRMPLPFHPWPDPFPGSEFHPSPPDYIRRREMTPPRSHQSLAHDQDLGPHTSSPMSVDVKDSRNSTPPHALPHFHDIPPLPPLNFFPPSSMHSSRLPLHPPPFRREHPAPRPADIRSPPPSQQSQSSLPSERWHHSNSQV